MAATPASACTWAVARVCTARWRRRAPGCPPHLQPTKLAKLPHLLQCRLRLHRALPSVAAAGDNAAPLRRPLVLPAGVPAALMWGCACILMPDANPSPTVSCRGGLCGGVGDAKASSMVCNGACRSTCSAGRLRRCPSLMPIPGVNQLLLHLISWHASRERALPIEQRRAAPVAWEMRGYVLCEV